MGRTGAKKQISLLPIGKMPCCSPPYTSNSSLVCGPFVCLQFVQDQITVLPELVAALSDLIDTLHKQSSASGVLTDSSLVLFMHCLHNYTLQIINAYQTVSGQ